jgi:hypothetical protein
VETLAKLFVLVAVADEAGIEVNCLAQQRRQVPDPGIWNAATFEKGLWYLAFGFENCVYANRRWALMVKRIT